MICEKCWGDSYVKDEGVPRVDRYLELIDDRRDNPCSPREQAGEFWDEDREQDIRLVVWPGHANNPEPLARAIAERDSAFNVLENVVNQSCGRSDGTLDSYALSSFSEALQYLASIGRVKIERMAGRRVIGRWMTKIEKDQGEP